MQNLSLQPSTPIYDLPKTIVLSMVLLAVFFASQLIGVVLFAPWVLQDAANLDIAEKVLQGSENGTLMSLSLGFTLAMVLGCVYLFIRFKNSRVKDYLALKSLTWYQLLQCSALLIGPAGHVELHSQVICAWRHIHMSPQDARQLNVSNGQKVSVRSNGERQLTFDEVVVRVRDDFALEFHIDTEEANAAGLKNGAQVTLIG